MEDALGEAATRRGHLERGERLDVNNLVAALLALHGGGLDGYPLPVARHEDARGLRCALVPAEDEQQRPLILIWNRTDSGLVPVLAQEADPVLREALSTTGDEVGAGIRQDWGPPAPGVTGRGGSWLHW